ncbi:MAG TPA: helix-turn-helix transcriptional regulator [Clostridiaceae bacterium]|nr:helix-turn-helix transcriptional regulator [Clostridiaceae bacterium]
MNIGHLIIDSTFKIINCNKTAFEFLKEISTRDNYKDGFDHLVKNILEISPQCSTKKTIDFMSQQIIYLDIETINDQILYSILIKPKTNSHISKIATKFDLSEREIDVISLIVQGLTYQETADQLFISINTVRTHIKNIYSKLGISNQRELCKLFN